MSEKPKASRWTEIRCYGYIPFRTDNWTCTDVICYTNDDLQKNLHKS